MPLFDAAVVKIRDTTQKRGMTALNVCSACKPMR